MIYLICILLTGLALGFTFLPLFRPQESKIYIDNLGETELEALLQKKDTLYSNMKDLEFDYKMGKLSEEDYRNLKEECVLEASAVLNQIDLLEHGSDLDALIEEEVQARRQSRSAGP